MSEYHQHQSGDAAEQAEGEWVPCAEDGINGLMWYPAPTTDEEQRMLRREAAQRIRRNTLPALPEGWDYLTISIPVDCTEPVDPDQIAQFAADAARAQATTCGTDYGTTCEDCDGTGWTVQGRSYKSGYPEEQYGRCVACRRRTCNAPDCTKNPGHMGAHE